MSANGPALDAGWSTCPGCGVVLPGSDADLPPRPNASAACWHLYGEVIGYEASHLAELGRYHQMMVDAYAAQHAGPGAAAIGVAFALIGLRLALDEGWRGEQVRDAHQNLGSHFKDWPAFERPPKTGDLTVFDVAMAGSPKEHAAVIQAWAADVWTAWRSRHADVTALIDERLPSDVRGRLHA
jgi:uncharacterized protein DUF5946